MRDSIGGTLLFWIVIILLSVFIVFIALIIKYAHVYKIKNSIVNYIEINEGASSHEEFDVNLLNYGYSKDGTYKLCRYLSNDKDKGGYYYVELYSVTTFPIVGNLAVVNITIKGETRNINTGTKIRSVDGWFNSPKSECKVCDLKTGDCVTSDA